MGNLPIKLLIPTQTGLRDISQVEKMVGHAERGGIFDYNELDKHRRDSKSPNAPLIQVSIFEDNEFYIHDGHHRVLAIYLSGRDHLKPEEYKVKTWTYALYEDIEIELGWFTPFDPRKEVRIADFSDFKKEVRSAISLCDSEKDFDILRKVIRNNKARYAVPRDNIQHIKQLGYCFLHT